MTLKDAPEKEASLTKALNILVIRVLASYLRCAFSCYGFVLSIKVSSLTNIIQIDVRQPLSYFGNLLATNSDGGYASCIKKDKDTEIVLVYICPCEINCTEQNKVVTRGCSFENPSDACRY